MSDESRAKPRTMQASDFADDYIHRNIGHPEWIDGGDCVTTSDELHTYMCDAFVAGWDAAKTVAAPKDGDPDRARKPCLIGCAWQARAEKAEAEVERLEAELSHYRDFLKTEDTDG